MRRKIMDIVNTIRQRYSQDNNDAMRNPWFIAMLGLIVVFLTVNIAFFVFAVTSNPGLVTDDYYEKGREYENNVISRINARNKLNWQTKFEMPERITANTPETYRFSAVDTRGVSIMDAEVKFILYRPSNSSADFIQVVDQIAPGLYQASLTLPLPGIWDITIKVTHDDDVYHHTHRITAVAP